MKILAILQNQWFRDPEKAREIFERNPGKRNELVKCFLFMRSKTGKRLERALGEDLCESIIWEEASPRIGGHASSNFGADPNHILNAVEKHQPNIVICFGKVAGEAVRILNLMVPVLYAPHPAARNNPMQELKLLPDKIAEAAANIFTKKESVRPAAGA